MVFVYVYIQGFIMYRTLPMSQFAKLQQRMFPVYYAVINGCTVLCLLSVFNSKYEKQKKILGSSLLCSLFHLSLISPRTNKYLDTYMALRDKEVKSMIILFIFYGNEFVT